MATDVFPVSIPNVIARKQRVQPVPQPAFHSSIIQPQSERETGREKPNGPDGSDDLEDPVSGVLTSSCLSADVFCEIDWFVVCRTYSWHTFVAPRSHEVLQTPSIAECFLGCYQVQYQL